MPGPIQGETPRLPPDAAGGPRPPALPRAQASGTEGEESRLKAACREMEALFVHQLLSEMRKSVVKSGLIDGGRAEEIYTSLQDEETAKDIARNDGLGLSSLLFEQLRRRDAAGSDPAADRREGEIRPVSGYLRRP
jgi:Rod binding domain-containing protein